MRFFEETRIKILWDLIILRNDVSFFFFYIQILEHMNYSGIEIFEILRYPRSSIEFVRSIIFLEIFTIPGAIIFFFWNSLYKFFLRSYRSYEYYYYYYYSIELLKSAIFWNFLSSRNNTSPRIFLTTILDDDVFLLPNLRVQSFSTILSRYVLILANILISLTRIHIQNSSKFFQISRFRTTLLLLLRRNISQPCSVHPFSSQFFFQHCFVPQTNSSLFTHPRFTRKGTRSRRSRESGGGGRRERTGRGVRRGRGGGEERERIVKRWRGGASWSRRA